MGSWRLRGAVTTAVLSLAVLAPASASAAVGAPITIGANGDSANVSVDAAGTAYITFNEKSPTGEHSTLMFCRLPRGAAACAPLTAVPTPGTTESLTPSLAFASGTTIRLLNYRYGFNTGPFAQLLLFTSTDGGATWDAGAQAGTVAPADFLFGPGNTMSVIDQATSCGSCFQNVPLDGTLATGPASLSGPGGVYAYGGTIALLDAVTPMAVVNDLNSNAVFWRYSGVGDLNFSASWTGPVPIAKMDYQHLASGPSGMFLISRDPAAGEALQARRFDGTTFGAPAAIGANTRPDDVVQDGSGRLHVIGGKFSAGPTGVALFYASSDDGARWAIDEAGFPGLPGDMRLAVAPDHFGVIAGRYASGASGAIFVAPVGPSAEIPTTAKFVDATVVSGTVLIQVPPSKKFVRLQTGDVIPVGSTVDATKGRVRITIAVPGGKLQSTDFFQGIFKVTQVKSGLATMVLGGGSFKSCPRGARGANAAKAKVIRQLWGAGAGKFRTKGRYATASIRGTTWDTIDRCDGTLIRVTAGRVVVTDLKKHKTITLKAGQSYLAKA
ncbi:MAG: hypothetical protein QOH13_2447 [Thermoleophilaceae bacterium]|nr:hypothetical protein [Thermoleophilaceae bacterium]